MEQLKSLHKFLYRRKDLATMTFEIDNYIKLNASSGNIVATIEGDLSANVTLLGESIIDESFTLHPPVTI